MLEVSFSLKSEELLETVLFYTTDCLVIQLIAPFYTTELVIILC